MDSNFFFFFFKKAKTYFKPYIMKKYPKTKCLALAEQWLLAWAASIHVPTWNLQDVTFNSFSEPTYPSTGHPSFVFRTSASVLASVNAGAHIH